MRIAALLLEALRAHAGGDSARVEVALLSAEELERELEELVA